jgi:hypothetical protein
VTWPLFALLVGYFLNTFSIKNGRVPYTSNWEVVKYGFSMGFLLYCGMGPFHYWAVFPSMIGFLLLIHFSRAFMNHQFAFKLTFTRPQIKLRIYGCLSHLGKHL